MKQDHEFIKKRTKPMLGFKPFDAAAITNRSAAITITAIVKWPYDSKETNDRS